MFKPLAVRDRRRRPAPPPRRRLVLETLEDRLLLAGTPPIDFSVINNWGSGFQGEIRITNDRAVNIADWTLEFNAPWNISQIWNAQLVSHSGSHYVITHAAWNGDIAPGAFTTFGFVASPGGSVPAPTDYVLTEGGGGGPPPGGGPALTIGNVTMNEGQNGTAQAVFTVFLSQAAAQNVTVSYATANGTAQAGSDYASQNGTLTFTPGQTQKTISVTVFGDPTIELDEDFEVRLSSPIGATISSGVGRGLLLDDDSTAPPTFNYAEALQKSMFFYDAQRSGDLPNGFRVEWRGDAALTDGADVGLDLSGGFWDAGDHVKFGLPMASSMTLLTWGLLQYRDGYVQSGQLPYLESNLRWGMDYLMKAHPSPNVYIAQVGNGDLDHTFWGAPEVMKMSRPSYRLDPTRPGSDAAGEAAASLAAAAIHFSASDPAYSAQLLQHARELYAFADQYRGKYSDSIPEAHFYSSSGYEDELVWGALWLFKATGERSYLDKAEAIYAQKFGGQSFTWTHAWDDKRYGSAVLLAQLTGKPGYRTDVERWLDYWTVGVNGSRVPYTPGGLAHLNQWGSLRYASTTAFLALIYSDTVKDYGTRYHDFAVRQMNYILGQNPNNRSFVVGFGASPPQLPHHRGASGVWDGNVDNPTPNRHILYGALVGGPESTNDNDYHDVRGNYISNEVALDYNAGFSGALARLTWEYGGQPLANFPAPETRDDEFFVQAKINQQTSTYTEISALLNNRSAWPARSSSNLAFRYFVNLSETYAAGYTAADIVVSSSFSQGATFGPLTAWNAGQFIYYVEVKFQGVEIVPGPGSFQKAALLRIGLRNGVPATAWNPGNDWSYQGLVAGGAEQKSRFIPVYEGLVKLFGDLPGQAGPPALTIGDLSITEGNSGTKTATFTVSLSAASAQPITVQYATQDGTARAGSDYLSTSGLLTFAPGVLSRTISVTILGDLLNEGNEGFQVVLTNPTNAVLGKASAVGTIVDDDAPAGPSVKFTVKDDWGAGFVADLAITNNGAADINGWILEFDFAVNITSIWNAVIVSRVGNHYTIRNAAWNGTIKAGQTVTFGFQADPGALGGKKPANYKLNGQPV